jgi:hypothetical protein
MPLIQVLNLAKAIKNGFFLEISFKLNVRHTACAKVLGWEEDGGHKYLIATIVKGIAREVGREVYEMRHGE